MDSEFAEHIELYCKLAELNNSRAYVDLLKAASTALVKGTQHAQNADESQMNLLGDSDALRKKAEESEAEVQRLNRQYQELRDQIKEEQTSYQKAIDEKDIKLSEMQKELINTREELDRVHQLAKRADLPTGDARDLEYPYISFCKVESLNPNRTRLRLQRLADVTGETILESQSVDYPERRDLYGRDRLDLRPGYYGVWLWKLEYNRMTGMNDYVNSVFYRPAIEIIVLANCASAEEIRAKLLRGIECSLVSDKVIFAYTDSPEQYVGLLCDNEELQHTDGIVSLKVYVPDLGLYRMTEKDLVRLSGRIFLSRLHAGIPEERIMIQDPLDTVRHMVLDYSTKAVMRQASFSNSERQRFCEFLQEMPVSNFADNISEIYGISENKAKQYVDAFKQKAQNYLNAQDFDSSVLFSAISNSPPLMQQCQALCEKNWKEENETLIQAANRAIQEKSDELNTISAVIAQKQEMANTLDLAYQDAL